MKPFLTFKACFAARCEVHWARRETRDAGGAAGKETSERVGEAEAGEEMTSGATLLAQQVNEAAADSIFLPSIGLSHRVNVQVEKLTPAVCHWVRP